MGESGRLLYRMKRPRDGALVLSLTPDEFLAHLATLVPPPRAHGVRYHGVFAPNSKLRNPTAPSAGGDFARVPWAELRRKVFAIDVLDCPKCSGRFTGGRAVDHLGLGARRRTHPVVVVPGPYSSAQ